jgi:hypothetical protein
MPTIGAPSSRATRRPKIACPGVKPKNETAMMVIANQASRLQLRGRSG